MRKRVGEMSHTDLVSLGVDLVYKEISKMLSDILSSPYSVDDFFKDKAKYHHFLGAKLLPSSPLLNKSLKKDIQEFCSGKALANFAHRLYNSPNKRFLHHQRENLDEKRVLMMFLEAHYNDSDDFFYALYLFCHEKLSLEKYFTVTASAGFSYSFFVDFVKKEIDITHFPLNYTYEMYRAQKNKLSLLKKVQSRLLGKGINSPNYDNIFSFIRSFPDSRENEEVSKYIVDHIDHGFPLSYKDYLCRKIKNIIATLPNYEKYLFSHEITLYKIPTESFSIAYIKQLLSYREGLQERVKLLGNEELDDTIKVICENLFYSPLAAYIELKPYHSLLYYFSTRQCKKSNLKDLPIVLTYLEQLKYRDESVIDANKNQDQLSFSEILKKIHRDQTNSGPTYPIATQISLNKTTVYDEILPTTDQKGAYLIQKAATISPFTLKQVKRVIKIVNNAEKTFPLVVYENFEAFILLFMEKLLGNTSNNINEVIEKFVFFRYALHDSCYSDYVASIVSVFNESFIDSFIDYLENVDTSIISWSLNSLPKDLPPDEYIDQLLDYHKLLSRENSYERMYENEQQNPKLLIEGVDSRGSMNFRLLCKMLKKWGYTISPGKGDHMKAYLEINGEKVGRTLIIDRNSQTISYRCKPLLYVARENKNTVESLYSK